MNHYLAGSRESLSKKASKLRVAASVLSDYFRSGCFRSAYSGRGIEFSGVREYLRGDDVRSIDWNVTARMGRPYVKNYEEERNMDVFVILDRSLSMFTGSKKRVKYEAAAEAAAIISIAGELNGSPVGTVFFDGRVSFSSAPKSGREQSMLLLSKYDEVHDVTKGSALANALIGSGRLLRQKAIVFIISDFRSSGWEDSFKMLASRHDVAAIRITDSSESELPELGSVPFTDNETGRRLVLPTNSEEFKSAWREDSHRRTSYLKNLFARNGAGFISVTTDDDVLYRLTNLFALKEASGKWRAGR